MYNLGLNQSIRISRKFILSNLLQGMGLHNYGGWLGKFEIRRTGHQAGQAGTLES